MTSVLNVDTIADKAGTGPVALTKQHAAKAWSNHDMSGTTARASFNIASYTDNAAGDHSMTVTSAFSSANYCWAYGGKRASGDGVNNFDANQVRAADPTTTVTRHGVKDHDSTSDVDAEHLCVMFMGDLA
tara:strand:+ start:201 stop:590 length:390 start_codon:yes stop_codon:yes gene_type:complete